MARAAFSNLMSGVGYWHGHSRVKSPSFQAGETKRYGSLTLLSAVPSKPFFPRGFIWDEGFHNLLIHQFDPLLSLDVRSRILLSDYRTASCRSLRHGWTP